MSNLRTPTAFKLHTVTAAFAKLDKAELQRIARALSLRADQVAAVDAMMAESGDSARRIIGDLIDLALLVHAEAAD